VHLRRALLLFAVVLGLAAVAASVSRPRQETNRRAVPPGFPPPTQPQKAPTVAPGSATPPGRAVELVFRAGRDRTRRLEPGRAATVVVEVDEPGHVEIRDLGVTQSAEPLTPARFEVLTSRSGRYPISFTPAGDDREEEAGTLVVRPPRE
jgi:hypothetical protein